MGNMDYSKNRSRNMSNQRRFYGDEPIYVTCTICRSKVVADGQHAMRVTADRGFKTKVGYRGPAQTWLCAGCKEQYSDLSLATADRLLEEAKQATARAGTNVSDTQQDVSEAGSSFWKWALAIGAAVIAAAVLGG